MTWAEQMRSANWAEAFWITFGAYAVGCFTTGYYLLRWRTGGDLRFEGSGNVGAKNAGRILGWGGFAITLAGDFAKGALVVWLASHLTRDDRFHGGKGIATSLGALLVYDFQLLAACALLFSVPFLLVRRTVLPGVFAFTCLPFVAAYLGNGPSRVVALTALAGLVAVAHRKNLAGELLRLGDRRVIEPKHSQTEL
jgi:glycerol-3-phosphate acyltransferase PlsY